MRPRCTSVASPHALIADTNTCALLVSESSISAFAVAAKRASPLTHRAKEGCRVRSNQCFPVVFRHRFEWRVVAQHRAFELVAHIARVAQVLAHNQGAIAVIGDDHRCVHLWSPPGGRLSGFAALCASLRTRLCALRCALGVPCEPIRCCCSTGSASPRAPINTSTLRP